MLSEALLAFRGFEIGKAFMGLGVAKAAAATTNTKTTPGNIFASGLSGMVSRHVQQSAASSISGQTGGSITGEHGVGREKINQMCAQFNSDELTLFHAVKAAFDPQGLLNPGKNIPTLHRCAEFGAMHIHHGQLPFPDLERF